VRLEGPVIRDLAYLFASDWYFATREDPADLADLLIRPVPGSGQGIAQVVPGAPERGGRNLEHAFFGAIVGARERLDIVTPYFVPDETLVDAIQYAALTGVEVRLVLPARSNHWYTTWAARSLYGPLLEAGVRIYERPGSFIHAKALLADGVYALFGSANLDYRSLHLNFELNLEIAEREFVTQFEEQIEREVAAGREILLAEHEARSAPRRLVENVCFLFQPVL
jgi:cardiolipin synthase